jgi:hypothetical protein
MAMDTKTRAKLAAETRWAKPGAKAKASARMKKMNRLLKQQEKGKRK